MKPILLLATLMLALVVPIAGQDTFSPDEEGFIRNWLVLAPIPMAGQSGADEIDYDLLNGEPNIKPAPDAQVTVGGAPLQWRAHQTFAYNIDFRESFDKTGGEYVVGYAVAYVHADAPMNVTLALGTNDQGKAWLNGKEVMKFTEARVLDMCQGAPRGIQVPADCRVHRRDAQERHGQDSQEGTCSPSLGATK